VFSMTGLTRSKPACVVGSRVHPGDDRRRTRGGALPAALWPTAKGGSRECHACPGEGVVSREFSEELGGCMVIETSQAGTIVVGGKAVGEFGAVVGQDGVHRQREAVEKALEKTGGGGGAAIGEDFEIDKAGGAIDCDIGVAAPAAERRQVFDVDMDEAGRRVG